MSEIVYVKVPEKKKPERHFVLLSLLASFLRYAIFFP